MDARKSRAVLLETLPRYGSVLPYAYDVYIIAACGSSTTLLKPQRI
jgi:hypothetical protein